MKEHLDILEKNFPEIWNRIKNEILELGAIRIEEFYERISKEIYLKGLKDGESKWISLEEKLPDLNVPVLISLKCGNSLEPETTTAIRKLDLKAYHPTEGVSEYQWEAFNDYIPTYESSEWFFDSQIAGWMPLPSPRRSS